MGLYLETDGRDIPVLDHFLASGETLPSQLPSPSDWSPEKKLAAAVLGAALLEVRDHHNDLSYRRRVTEDLEWIFADDHEWPFSFVRLCELFDLEPQYVRGIVRRWQTSENGRSQRQVSVHRHAA
jgi:hypothetical protein